MRKRLFACQLLNMPSYAKFCKFLCLRRIFLLFIDLAAGNYIA